MAERLVRLDGPANFRDLGGYQAGNGELVRTGRLFRSDSLSYMSDEDVRHVTEVLGLRSVVDLRGIGEVERFTHGPLGSLGVQVSHVPIIDETRRPPDGWSDGADKSIDKIYLIMLDRFGHRFAEVLRILADPDRQPLVFHCAAGKDRTGLVAMLVLGILGVDRDVIAADYALTHERMPVLLERHQARGTGGAVVEVAEQHFQVDEAAMREVVDHLVAEYGSVEGYALAQGVEPSTIASLKASLLS